MRRAATSARVRSFRWLGLAALYACASASSQPAVWVNSVEVAGTQELDAGDLAGVLETKATGIWPWSKKQPFVQDAMLQDSERIERAAAEQGFFATIVRTDLAGEGEARDVRFVVTEGARSKILQVNVTGQQASSSPSSESTSAPVSAHPMPADVDFSAVLEKNDIVVGRFYQQASYEKAKTALFEYLHAEGYPDAQVAGRVRVDKARAEVAVDFAVELGAKVRLAGLVVNGSGELPADRLRSLAEFPPGTPYSPNVMADTESRFYETGVIGAAKLELKPLAASQPSAQNAFANDGSFEWRDVHAEVTPAPLHEVRLGGGLGFQRRRQEIRLRAEYAHFNFLGGLRQLRISLRPAYAVIPTFWELRQHGPAGEFEVSLAQPNFLGTRLTSFILFGYDLGIQEGFQFHGPRVQLGVERPFFRQRLRIGGSWNLQYLNFFNVDTAVFDPLTTPLGLGFRNPYRLAYLEAFVMLDLRDSTLETTKGLYAEVRAEWGSEFFASQFNYLKLKPEVRGYISLGERITFAARAQLGWMEPYGADRARESPLTRRFALGGPTSHRGFSIGRLAPQVPSGDCAVNPAGCRTIPVGGHGSLLFQLDVRIRVVKLLGYWLGLVPFLDAGDVAAEFSNLSLAKLHVATGLSVVYLAPFGELRIGTGVRLNRLRATELDGTTNPDGCTDVSFTKCAERFAFHLSIGGAF